MNQLQVLIFWLTVLLVPPFITMHYLSTDRQQHRTKLKPYGIIDYVEIGKINRFDLPDNHYTDDRGYECIKSTGITLCTPKEAK